MAGLPFTIKTTEQATGTSKITMLQLVAPTNQGVLVDEWSVSFEGVAPTDPPILVELFLQSTAGSGGTPVTPAKARTSDPAIQSTANQHLAASAQPTDVRCIARRFVHPQDGYTWQAPYKKEIPVQGGERLGIAITAENGVDCVCSMSCEE